MTRRMVIMGAAGRDFHVFNCCYRGNDEVNVVAFTAAQIPHIEQRTYPPELAGPSYPHGIPVHPEDELEQIIQNDLVTDVVFAYSDVSFEFLKDVAQRVEAC